MSSEGERLHGMMAPPRPPGDPPPEPLGDPEQEPVGDPVREPEEEPEPEPDDEELGAHIPYPLSDVRPLNAYASHRMDSLILRFGSLIRRKSSLFD